MAAERPPAETLDYVVRMLRDLHGQAEAAQLRDLAYLLALAQREARERARALGRADEE